MNIKRIAKIRGTQDGEICNNYLFRFDAEGYCVVYDLNAIKHSKDEYAQKLAEFRLDKTEKIKPHSNSIAFGKEYYATDDEFPLLYANIYNNYANAENPMKGVCLVYRIKRNGGEFSTSLVQIIEIGFVEDSFHWKSKGIKADVRPYGNFAIDTDNGILYAFTMRDESETTRYFSFDLPKVSEGKIDDGIGVRKVVLKISDIKEYFDCEYHRYLQGACYHNGKIYSAEGFSNSNENPPALRVIDVKAKKQILFVNLLELGYNIEPEMISFEDNICYYSDYDGNLYTVDF